MARAISGAYDAYLDALKGDRYYITAGEPTDSTEVTAMKCNDFVASGNGANGAGPSSGRQFTVPAKTGILITKTDSATSITQTDASDNPLHSTDLSNSPVSVTVGQSVNVDAYVCSIPGVVSA
jgi:hypothetical protein